MVLQGDVDHDYISRSTVGEKHGCCGGSRDSVEFWDLGGIDGDREHWL